MKKIFQTNLMTKYKIGIKFFPNYTIWTKFVGSDLHGKEILIGRDVLVQNPKLQILANDL